MLLYTVTAKSSITVGLVNVNMFVLYVDNHCMHTIVKAHGAKLQFCTFIADNPGNARLANFIINSNQFF